MILGLTPIGFIHTLISLVAVGAGIVAFVRMGAITLHARPGQVYVIATILTCLTGFPIFQKGGFGPPHVLGVLTLLVLTAAILAEKKEIFGRTSTHIATVGYSLTFFFHMIPGFTETFTRLPPSSPLVTGPEDPILQAAIGAAFGIFLIGAVVQVRRLRARNSSMFRKGDQSAGTTR